MQRAIVHASHLYTGAGIRKKDGRRIVDADLNVISDGALVYSTKASGKSSKREIPDRIEWVGATKDLPKEWANVPKDDLEGKFALMPGLVDCHNHLIFGGDRSDEFAQRCAGATYEQIAAAGGGIVSTVKATRMASEKELEILALERLKQLYAFGVRTLEIKSGYGLSLESELKILKVIPGLRDHFPDMTLTSTFLAAHAFPPECKSESQKESYFQSVVQEMLPRVVQEKVADSCDIFVDRGYFTVDQGRTLLTEAKKQGLKIKVHADELVNTESAALAAELGALSADHLLCISDLGIEKISKSQTVAVLLPGTAFYLKAGQAPARKLLDAGARVALATDFNPGTCMCLSPPAIMTIAALYLGMSRAEIFSAFTFNAAQALGLGDRKGTLEAGLDADFYILPFQRFEEIYYRFAWAP